MNSKNQEITVDDLIFLFRVRNTANRRELAKLIDRTPETILGWIKSNKIPKYYQIILNEIKTQNILWSNSSNTILNVYDSYLLARWYWQGFKIVEISNTVGASIQSVSSFLAKHKIREKEFGRKGPRKNKKERLKEIKEKYGELVYNLILDYPNDPLTSMVDIAKLMSKSRQRVKQILDIIHGKEKLSLKKKSKTTCIIKNNLPEPFNSKLQEEGIKYIKLNSILYEAENEKTFVLRKLSKIKTHYRLTTLAKCDFIVFENNNEVYVVSYPDFDTTTIYFNKIYDFSKLKDFSCLKNKPNRKEKEKEEESIPYGYCHCGCGQKTEVLKSSIGKYKKEEPKKYIKGHRKNYSCKTEDFLCSICDKKIKRRNWSQEIVCPSCKNKTTNTNIEKNKRCKNCENNFIPKYNDNNNKKGFCSEECHINYIQKEQQDLSERFEKIKYELSSKGITLSDIAKLMNVSLATVKVRWWKGDINKQRIEELELLPKKRRLEELNVSLKIK